MKVLSFFFILFFVLSGIICYSVENEHMINFVKEEVMKKLRDETNEYFQRQSRYIRELEQFQVKQSQQIREIEKNRKEQSLLIAELKKYQEIQKETIDMLTKKCERENRQKEYSVNQKNGYMHRQPETYTNEIKQLNTGTQENITANLHKWSLQKNVENDRSIELAQDVRRTERILPNIGQDVMVAFYAHMSTSEPNPGQHHTFIFDTIMTNSGSGYSKHNGMFTAPNHGHYVFTWTVISERHGWIYSEIVINSSAFGSILSDSQYSNEEHPVTSTIVVELNLGDVVYIRTNPTISIKGGIFSSSLLRTSFSGWKIF